MHKRETSSNLENLKGFEQSKRREIDIGYFLNEDYIKTQGIPDIAGQTDQYNIS